MKKLVPYAGAEKPASRPGPRLKEVEPVTLEKLLVTELVRIAKDIAVLERKRTKLVNELAHVRKKHNVEKKKDWQRKNWWRFKQSSPS